MNEKMVIVSAPSGAGKTTIVRHLSAIPELKLFFAVSACTRAKREGETEGKDYYFMSIDDFKEKIEEDAFIEWEEVYKNHYYGTLRKEVSRIWNMGRNIILDLDVMGGINLKNKFGDHAFSLFVMPPSLDVLKQRLEKRGTESPSKIAARINKASLELKFARKFDAIVINENLDSTLLKAEKLVKEFLLGNNGI